MLFRSEIGNGAAGEALLTLGQADIRALAELPQAIAPWHQALVRLLQIWPQVTELADKGDQGDQQLDKLRAPLAEIHTVALRIGSGLKSLRPDLSVAAGRMPEGLALLSEYSAMARDRKSTRLNSSHTDITRMPSSA